MMPVANSWWGCGEGVAGELLIITAGRVQASREPGVSEFSSSKRRNLVATLTSI